MGHGLTTPSNQFQVLEGKDLYDMEVRLSVMTDISVTLQALTCNLLIKTQLHLSLCVGSF